jgi:GNAT superfamily N-acetyltransferase
MNIPEKVAHHACEPHIIPLAECPLLAPVVAQGHFAEWGHLYPGGTVDGWLDHIKTRMNRDRISTTVVALDGEEPLGTGALVEHDMETHPELSPWLGGVYVVPIARRRGIASAIVRHVMSCAANFGVRDLYLYTASAERLYEKLGWRLLSREPYMRREISLMTSRSPSNSTLERTGFARRSP